MSRGVRAVAGAVLCAGLLAACAGTQAQDAPGSATPAASAAGAAAPSEPMTPTTAPSATSQAPSESPDADADAGAPTVESPVTQQPAPAAEPPAPVEAAPVPEQLQFTATTLDGAAFSGADLAGKPVVLWFWAPWCPNCRAEAPQVAAAAAATNGEVTFVGVAAQDDLAPMQAFVDNYGVGGFEHLADLDAAIWQRFGVTYQPAYAFIGADGAVEVVKSRVSAAELAERLEQLTAS